ncbi:MAG: RAMP superfamily CRISPR-associated protein [archaeon YNP-WB-062]|nr:RAMP superfamily CRISPR-associated protein [Candidatus Culexarchaeum yellowstonense]
MNDYRDFHKLNVFIRVDGFLVNETPLRVGVGREPPLGSAVDIAVYMVNGFPCIPGSSLKGLFRSYLESIVSSMGCKVHDPWDEQAIREEAKNRNFCPICGIFGNTELASHVRIYDSYPKDGVFHMFQKTGIAIDRVFGSVRPGLGPFIEELISPKTKWTFRMDIINIDLYPEKPTNDDRVKLLKNLFKTLTGIGLNIGARKSVGCGLVRLEEAKWRRYELQDGLLKMVGEGEVK